MRESLIVKVDHEQTAESSMDVPKFRMPLALWKHGISRRVEAYNKPGVDHLTISDYQHVQER